MAKLTLPYEITKLFDIRIDPLTGERKISLKRNYAFPIEENFKTIKKYLSDLISGENLTSITKKRTIHLIPQNAVLPTSNPPALTKITGTNHTYYTLDFDPDTDESAFWHFSIPINWNGELPTIKLKYIANATSGVVKWSVFIKKVAEDESVDPVSSKGWITVEDTVSPTANYLNIVNQIFSAFGVNAGEWLILELLRDADSEKDTLTVDARLLEIVIEWNI